MPWEIDEMALEPENIEKYGRPLRNEEEIKKALNDETFLNPNSAKADATHYKQLGFQCYCNEQMHPMNEDFRAKLILSATGERFLYHCISMGMYVFFRVKNVLLVHSCVPIWYVDGHLFESCFGEILKKHKNYKDINI